VRERLPPPGVESEPRASKRMPTDWPGVTTPSFAPFDQRAGEGDAVVDGAAGGELGRAGEVAGLETALAVSSIWACVDVASAAVVTTDAFDMKGRTCTLVAGMRCDSGRPRSTENDDRTNDDQPGESDGSRPSPRPTDCLASASDEQRAGRGDDGERRRLGNDRIDRESADKVLRRVRATDEGAVGDRAGGEVDVVEQVRAERAVDRGIRAS
jgi:hypothetical protein